MFRLSVKRVEALAEPGRYADGGNLYLRVSTNGGRRWVFLYQRSGRIHELGLGSARPGHVGLKDAREHASDLRARLRRGEDLMKIRREQRIRLAPLFGEFAEEVVASLTRGFSNAKHADQWRTTLRQHAKALREIPVDEIDTRAVLAVLNPLWESRPETASRLRGRIEKVLNAAKAQGHRTGDNPARWRGHLDQTLPPPRKLTRGHFAALRFTQMPDFFERLHQRPANAARALAFLILTATRSGEVRGATWQEIDLIERTWTIPAKRMKVKREHRVPLTDAMMELLGDPPTNASTLLFPGPSGTKPLSETAFAQLLDRLGFGSITPHGFRSSFRDWAAECTDTPHEVAEMALAHVIANKAEAAYRRGDLFTKRRKLMEAWGAFCDDASGAHAASQPAP